MTHVANDAPRSSVPLLSLGEKTPALCGTGLNDPILPLLKLLGRASLAVGLVCGWAWAFSLILGSDF